MQFVATLLDAHYRRYPEMQLADIYKLLHQAALGCEHSVHAMSARTRLEQEADRAAAGPEEPLLDPISPDGRLARVHLRTYFKEARSLDGLLNAFVQTASGYAPSVPRLAKFCACLGDLARDRRILFPPAEVDAFVGELAGAGYPAVHHSAAYRAAYSPAYRVVAVEYLSLAT